MVERVCVGWEFVEQTHEFAPCIREQLRDLHRVAAKREELGRRRRDVHWLLRASNDTLCEIELNDHEALAGDDVLGHFDEGDFALSVVLWHHSVL